MNLPFLKSAAQKKAALSLKISALRSGILGAEKALSIVKGLRSTLPGRIAQIRGTIYTLSISEFCAIEDALTVKSALIADRRAVEAMERMAADLNAIEAHWKGRLKDLQS